MSYTTADLTAVNAAIGNIRDGKSVTRITIAGKTIHYNEPPTLADLIRLRNDIKSEVNATAGRRRFVLTSSRKGL